MAGSTTTFTEKTTGSVKEIKCAWLSDDGTGAVSGTTTNSYNGKILGLATVPGTAGDQPDDNYDVAVTDGNSLDVLMGGGANRDETNTEYVLSTSLGAVVNSKLTVAVTAAGNALQGTVYIYIR